MKLGEVGDFLITLLLLFPGRYVLQAMKHMEPQVKQVFQSLPKSVRHNKHFWEFFAGCV